MKVLIVGAGMFGATCARALKDAGHSVVVIDARQHIGGNCYTVHDPESGAHIHKYGPHIFHTDNAYVWRWVQQFASFNNFRNSPVANVDGKIFSLPINLMTFNQLFGCTVPEEAEEYLAAERVPIDNPANMEEACLARMGRPLYELFFEGYTTKQWGMHPSKLPAYIASRLPLRTTFDNSYFNHRYQGIPINGYTDMFGRMLDGIDVELGSGTITAGSHRLKGWDRVIFTGAIDEFFDYRLGELEYRSLSFQTQTFRQPDYQGNAVVNYPSKNIGFTRIVEHKHFTPGLKTGSTVVTWEYPADWKPGRERFYPVGTPKNEAWAAQYADLARAEHPNITFGGRLGSYRYMDMDKTIEAALETVSTITTGVPT